MTYMCSILICLVLILCARGAEADDNGNYGNGMASVRTQGNTYDDLASLISYLTRHSFRRPFHECALCYSITDPGERQRCIDMYCSYTN
uniref:Aragonite protein AP7 n=1 Tax=Haliotis rufescens TaxID=6454 RepID=Q9BP37_HALRU|nr:aragonite protein AP7 precursor [Haliotis rufescens]